MPRVIVYIDGLNLYYRSLKGTSHKWLNLEALCEAVLPSSLKVVAINYYTAIISARTDPTALARQHAYLSAIQTLPLVRVHRSNFLETKKWARLVQPLSFKPDPIQPPQFQPLPVVAKVWKTEEKGSDVKLGVHLVRDALTGACDQAAVLTNDTDLVEPLRIVTQDVKLPVTLLTPCTKPARPAQSLKDVATSMRHIQPYLGPCQFPDPVVGATGEIIRKPASW